MSINLGTRKSKLALRQCEKVIRELEDIEVEARKQTVATKGDEEANIYIHEIEGVGVFERKIDLLVLRGELDAGVHSMKDIPSDLPKGIKIVAVLDRAWPRDLLVSKEYKSLSDLPEGSAVGTSSVRRRAQLLWRRPDLEIRNLRGNVDTRLGKLEGNKYDAMVLAEAGLKRLGQSDYEEFTLPSLPAANQGAIAVTARTESEAAEQIANISDKKTFRETHLERKVTEQVGGGCDIPLGVLVEKHEDQISIQVRIFTDDGSQSFEVTETVIDEKADSRVEKIGKEVAAWREKYI
ncbi:MAG: hydroxymethylbilane synthase [Candidatus Bipolaricaulota bacterium]